MNAAHEAVVTFALHGSAGQTRDIEAVIDTAFSVFLSLTPALGGGVGIGLSGHEPGDLGRWQ